MCLRGGSGTRPTGGGEASPGFASVTELSAILPARFRIESCKMRRPLVKIDDRVERRNQPCAP
jgi:hypothetical protein